MIFQLLWCYYVLVCPVSNKDMVIHVACFVYFLHCPDFYVRIIYVLFPDSVGDKLIDSTHVDQLFFHAQGCMVGDTECLVAFLNELSMNSALG